VSGQNSKQEMKAFQSRFLFCRFRGAPWRQRRALRIGVEMREVEALVLDEVDGLDELLRLVASEIQLVSHVKRAPLEMAALMAADFSNER
jgi:hypothetical protein